MSTKLSARKSSNIQRIAGCTKINVVAKIVPSMIGKIMIV
jgi:hypothetical protein